MRSFAAIIVVLGLMAVSAHAQSFCHHLNCPPYTVVSTDGTFEIRQYPETWWVTTNWTGFSFDEAGNVGFNRLFDYISGDNSADEKIPMTTPVTTEILPGAGPFCASTFWVSFYLPNNFQATGNAPQPGESDVALHSSSARTIAVNQFGGFAHWDNSAAAASSLADWLTNQDIPFNPTLTVAQYNSPFDVIKRHNEVWYEVFLPKQ